jgi:hypothetical protein
MHAFTRLGAGAFRLGASGDAADPYRGRSAQAWSAAGSLGLGLRSAGLRPIMILATVVPTVGAETRRRIRWSSCRKQGASDLRRPSRNRSRMVRAVSCLLVASLLIGCGILLLWPSTVARDRRRESRRPASGSVPRVRG